MRKLAFVVALVLSLTAPAFAGGIGVMYSSWNTDTAEDDQGPGVKVAVDMSQNLDVVLRASFFDSFAQVDRGERYEIEVTPVDLGLAWSFSPDGRVNPYLGAGGSFLFVKPNPAEGRETTSRPHSQEEFGWYGELGLEFVAARSFSVFVEAIYRDASSEVRGRDLGTVPEAPFEVDFGGTAVNLGLLFTW